jgi:hypothetical protein
MASAKYPLVKTVYTGKSGCACGCRGNYTENASVIARVVNTLAAHATEVTYCTDADGSLIASVDVEGRRYTVYGTPPVTERPAA